MVLFSVGFCKKSSKMNGFDGKERISPNLNNEHFLWTTQWMFKIWIMLIEKLSLQMIHRYVDSGRGLMGWKLYQKNSSRGKEVGVAVCDGLCAVVFGAICGAVYGEIFDAICGVICGAIYGTIFGAVAGAVYGEIFGAVCGGIYGTIFDAVAAGVYVTIFGAVYGEIFREIYGAVYRAICGAIFGTIFGAVYTWRNKKKEQTLKLGHKK
eukprot:489976_1